MSLATQFAGASAHAPKDTQHDFGFAHSDEQSSPLRARAKRREADWRAQLARALQYALGKSPEQAEELIAECEQLEQEGPDFMRQRPGSVITEAPMVKLGRETRRRLWGKFRTLCRRSWQAKAPGKHRGAITRAMEATFLALMYLAEKYGRVYPSLVCMLAQHHAETLKPKQRKNLWRALRQPKSCPVRNVEPGKPASSTVGMSGAEVMRTFAVIA
jgi:hypothetical protein